MKGENMDEMRVMSKVMCGIVSALLQYAVRKCCGAKTKVKLDSVACSHVDGAVTIHVKDLDISMSAQDFQKMILGRLGTEDED